MRSVTSRPASLRSVCTWRMTSRAQPSWIRSSSSRVSSATTMPLGVSAVRTPCAGWRSNTKISAREVLGPAGEPDGLALADRLDRGGARRRRSSSSIWPVTRRAALRSTGPARLKSSARWSSSSSREVVGELDTLDVQLGRGSCPAGAASAARASSSATIVTAGSGWRTRSFASSRRRSAVLITLRTVRVASSSAVVAPLRREPRARARGARTRPRRRRTGGSPAATARR